MDWSFHNWSKKAWSASVGAISFSIKLALAKCQRESLPLLWKVLSFNFGSLRPRSYNQDLSTNRINIRWHIEVLDNSRSVWKEPAKHLAHLLVLEKTRHEPDIWSINQAEISNPIVFPTVLFRLFCMTDPFPLWVQDTMASTSALRYDQLRWMHRTEE
jgi:hypothetical protein